LDAFLETWPNSGMMRNGQCSERTTSALRIDANGSGFWPTPNAGDGHKAEHQASWEARAKRKAASGINLHFPLRQAVQMFPTPTAGDSKAVVRFPTPRASDSTRGAGESATVQGGPSLNSAAGPGQLNPTWVEWLMGWPLGWTDCAPLETGRFLEWQQQHSSSCASEGVGKR
jgi:hypothetical protein